jgi:hypothetical protein
MSNSTPDATQIRAREAIGDGVFAGDDAHVWVRSMKMAFRESRLVDLIDHGLQLIPKRLQSHETFWRSRVCPPTRV